jgi:Sigma-70 region 2
MDDDELIAAIASGDGDDTALRELFSRHAPWLAARLRKALPPDDVEDVLQETFIAVWQNAKTYQQAVITALPAKVGSQVQFGEDEINGRPTVGTTPAQIHAVAQRFASLLPAARHAWLAAHLPALRAGTITLAQLP